MTPPAARTVQPLTDIPDAAWHTLAIDDALRRLASDREGLSVAEAVRRLAVFGPNTLPREPLPAVWRLAIGQLANPLVLLLLAAALVSFAIGDTKDAIIIAVVIAIDAGLGTWQEAKAHRSSRALEKLLQIRAAVSRGGTVCEIPADEVVPGDILWLESGNRVPADARLLATHGLEVDESLLTGESLPVTKDAAWTGSPEAALADRSDMVYAGSIVTRGRASAVVVATGLRTSVGELAIDVAARAAGKPPLVARMERFTRSVAVAVVAAAAAIGLLGVAVGQRPQEMFLFAVVLAVSAIPEGLPVSLTIALAIATGRMAARGVIVRRLPAVEGLGSCTLIATDKTGTLTCNELTVTTLELPATDRDPPERLAVSGQGFVPTGSVLRDGRAVPLPQAGLARSAEPRLHSLVACGVLCNEATLHHRDGAWTWRGDAVDVALLSLGVKQGLEREALLAEGPQFDELPFEPEHRFAVTFHTFPHGRIACVKGAPEAVLPMCGGAPEQLASWQERATALAAEGLRVLAFAQGRVTVGGSAQHPPPVLDGLDFLGFMGLVDPLRQGVGEAVRQCGRAGIRVVMITGDHRLTSLAIARQLDLTHDDTDVVTGGELAAMPPHRFTEAVRTARVFARVTPRQKLQIVEAARAAGHFVAVTGDGVNDAPALRAANIGVAMGRGGTDVAREAAGLVISDDNFATIVAGVEEGRIAYDNVRKVIFLLVSTGAAEMVLVTLAVATGSPLPLTAAQLLWLNLVTNGIQDVALAFEPGQGDELDRPPRPPDEPIFDRGMVGRIAISAVVMGVAAFVVFRVWLDAGTQAATDHGVVGATALSAARHATLLVMVLFENVHLANCRSETHSAFSTPPWKSPLLLTGTLTALAVHLLAMHWPPAQAILDVAPASGREWLVLSAVALTILPAIELHKWWIRRQSSGFTESGV
jgi:magnesium-transporting ATPase (P-type)